jgi:hypothetical protein
MKNKLLLLCIILSLGLSQTASAIHLIMPARSAQNGTQVTIPVRATGFTSIMSCQFTVDFNASVLSYVSVQGFGLAGMNASNFGTTQTSSGKLTFLWTDPASTGVTMADTVTFFTVTFNVIGSAGQSSQLNFGSVPTVVEIVDASYNTLTPVITNGSLSVSASAPVYDLTLKLDTISGTQGSVVSVSLRATDFVNIMALQGTIKFNPAVVTYSSVSYYGLPGMSATDFGTTQVSSGKLTFLWTDASMTGINMANNAALFTLNFNLSGAAGSSTYLNFATTPTPWEVSDSLFSVLSADTLKGRITIRPVSVGTNHYDETAGLSLKSYPNPVYQNSTFEINMPEAGEANLSIYDINGRMVYTLSSAYPAGSNIIRWSSTDSEGRKLNPGIYCARLTTAGSSASTTIILAE